MLKINFLGDSITEGCCTSGTQHTFVYLVGKMLNAETRNYGVGGTRIAPQTKKSLEPIWDLDFIQRAKKMNHDADYIFVFGGTNDYGHGDAPFGKIGDKTPDTFCGAVDYLINYLLHHYKKEQIIFTPPLHRANEDSPYGDGSRTSPANILKVYTDALVDIVKSYDIKIFDMKEEMGPGENNPLFEDGLHPNDLGHQKMAELLVDYIKKL